MNYYRRAHSYERSAGIKNSDVLKCTTVLKKKTLLAGVEYPMVHYWICEVQLSMYIVECRQSWIDNEMAF